MGNHFGPHLSKALPFSVLEAACQGTVHIYLSIWHASVTTCQSGKQSPSHYGQGARLAKWASHAVLKHSSELSWRTATGSFTLDQIAKSQLGNHPSIDSCGWGYPTSKCINKGPACCLESKQYESTVRALGGKPPTLTKVTIVP